MEKIYKCPKCGEVKNLHYNYDYNQQHRPIVDVLCNNCGEFFDGDIPVSEITNYPELEGTNALCHGILWDEIYDEYSTEQYPPFGGPFTDSLSFIDWLKKNYKSPERL